MTSKCLVRSAAMAAMLVSVPGCWWFWPPPVQPELRAWIQPSATVETVGTPVVFELMVENWVPQTFVVWHASDGTPNRGEIDLSIGRILVRTFAHEGRYVVSALVKSGDGQQKWPEIEVEIIPKVPPVNPPPIQPLTATISSPLNGAEFSQGDEVLFSAVVNGGTPPYQHRWFLYFGSPIEEGPSIKRQLWITTEGEFVPIYFQATDSRGEKSPLLSAEIRVW